MSACFWYSLSSQIVYYILVCLWRSESVISEDLKQRSGWLAALTRPKKQKGY